MKTKMLLQCAAGIVLLCLLNLMIYAQTPPAKQWDKRFGGSKEESLYGLLQTSDGGYIMGGSSRSPVSGDKTQPNWDPTNSTDDYWVVKVDANGIKQWDKRYGGNFVEQFWSLQPTSDGGYILAGNSGSPISGDKTQGVWGGSYYDYWIVKVDANGVKQWDKRFGGTILEQCLAVRQTKDGGYILGGHSDSHADGDKTQDACPNDFQNSQNDYWIVKTDANGNKQWDADYGGDDADALETLEQTSDGGYILGGVSFSGVSCQKTQSNRDSTNSTKDMWIIKTDANGIKQWDKRYGGTNEDGVSSIQQTSDGGYILGGYSASGISGDKTQPSQGAYDMWVVKIDANGTKQWDKRFGGTGYDDCGYVRQTIDGGYLLGGESSSGISGDKTQANRDATNSTYDYWVVKIDANGIKQWDATYGGNDQDFGGFIHTTTDNGYILGGSSLSGISGDKTQASQGDYDYWIVKLGAASSTCANATSLTTTNVTANSAKLNWTAAVNPSKWQIQYKPVITGATWTSVKPAGTARSTTISSLVANQAYKWRIRALCNGTWTVYSATKSFKTLPAAQQLITSSEHIKAEKASALRLYPNPSKGSVNVQYSSLYTGKVQLKVVDMAGRTIFSSSEAAVHGNNTYHLNLPQLASGIYNLELTYYNKETNRVKFVIQK